MEVGVMAEVGVVTEVTPVLYVVSANWKEENSKLNTK